jgi:hypothetical protein
MVCGEICSNCYFEWWGWHKIGETGADKLGGKVGGDSKKSRSDIDLTKIKREPIQWESWVEQLKKMEMLLSQEEEDGALNWMGDEAPGWMKANCAF